MSKMAELAYDIEQLYIEGLNAGQIARQLNCPKEIVLDWIADQGISPFDEWDVDAQERLIQDLYSPHNTVNS
jgi:hypothetical protein